MRGRMSRPKSTRPEVAVPVAAGVGGSSPPTSGSKALQPQAEAARSAAQRRMERRRPAGSGVAARAGGTPALHAALRDSGDPLRSTPMGDGHTVNGEGTSQHRTSEPHLM